MSPRLVIFDLDGVLIESRDMHWKTLNMALAEFGYKQIEHHEHLARFDGLPTSKKLDMLGILGDVREGIWAAKQLATARMIQQTPQDPDLIRIFTMLRNNDIRVAVASNATHRTTTAALARLGLLELTDAIVTPDDVKRPKPYPEVYWRAMEAVGAVATNTVIVEDSHIGRQGAHDSGAILVPVEGRADVSYEKVMAAFPPPAMPQPWRQKALRVLIPMAGLGSRFAEAGYTFPKPLVEVNGKPMIQAVVENLNVADAEFIFIVQREHFDKYHLGYLLNLIAPNCRIIQLDGVTEGAAATTLIARELINDERPLLLANSDQLLEWNVNETLYAFNADGISGGIVTFKASHPKWSYVKLGDNGFAHTVAEKRVISNLATAGVYYWKHGRDYVRCAEAMIAKDIRTNGEFYVAPVFNEAIQEGLNIRVKDCSRLWGLGTPEDLRTYLDAHKE